MTDQTSGINKFPSYEARRTDHASGNDYIYFNVNDLFLKGGSNNIRVYVSYLDNSTSPFYLEYDAADGNHTKRVTSSSNIVFTNSGAWKTGYFALPDDAFSNGQTSGMDFAFTTVVLVISRGARRRDDCETEHFCLPSNFSSVHRREEQTPPVRGGLTIIGSRTSEASAFATLSCEK